MTHYKCACPDISDINTGTVICERCNGLKVDIPQRELTEGQKREIDAYLKLIRSEDTP
jgi:hypothetical protein